MEGTAAAVAMEVTEAMMTVAATEPPRTGTAGAADTDRPEAEEDTVADLGAKPRVIRSHVLL